jgi:hypothetical protein
MPAALSATGPVVLNFAAKALTAHTWRAQESASVNTVEESAWETCVRQSVRARSVVLGAQVNTVQPVAQGQTAPPAAWAKVAVILWFQPASKRCLQSPKLLKRALNDLTAKLLRANPTCDLARSLTKLLHQATILSPTSFRPFFRFLPINKGQVATRV